MPYSVHLMLFLAFISVSSNSLAMPTKDPLKIIKDDLSNSGIITPPKEFKILPSLCNIPISNLKIYFREPIEKLNALIHERHASQNEYKIIGYEPNFAGKVFENNFQEPVRFLSESNLLLAIKEKKEWTSAIPNSKYAAPLVSKIIWDEPTMIFAKGALTTGALTFSSYQITIFITKQCEIFFDITSPAPFDEVEQYFMKFHEALRSNTKIKFINLKDEFLQERILLKLSLLLKMSLLIIFPTIFILLFFFFKRKRAYSSSSS